MSNKGIPQTIPELYAALRMDIGGLRGEMEDLRKEVREVKKEVQDVKTGLGQLAIVSSQTLKYLSERIPA